jgi:primary-amine oxidase
MAHHATTVPHPLDQLRSHEVNVAREVILRGRPGVVLQFRTIVLREPAKPELTAFLAVEHSGNLTPSTPRPPRLAEVQFDVINNDKSHDYTESIVDVNTKKELRSRTLDSTSQPPFIV